LLAVHVMSIYVLPETKGLGYKSTVTTGHLSTRKSLGGKAQKDAGPPSIRILPSITTRPP
jgi:hypothetical protein